MKEMEVELQRKEERGGNGGKGKRGKRERESD